jgi:HB1/ASXL restriction endonuclease-like protein with HTH domain/restriction endonuclease
MTFLEAALKILQWEGKPLHYKELTERALAKKLLTFVGRTPEVTMQTQLTAAIKKAPGNPFVRVKPGTFGLLRYPELSPEERDREREAGGKAEAAAPAERASRPSETDTNGAGDAAPGRRRRRRGRGRERPPEAAEPAAGAAATAVHDDVAEIEEPAPRGLSAEARAAALAETGVLEGNDDPAGDDEEDSTSMANDASIATRDDEPERQAVRGDADAGDEAHADDDLADDAADANDEPAGAAGESGDAARPFGDDSGPGRRRRRRRRRGGRPESEGGLVEPRANESGASSGAADSAGSAATALAEGQSEAAPATGSGESASSTGAPPIDDRQGPRRIMTPVDAALEILRGKVPGRGVHVREIADGAVRRRLLHGEPNEVWRVVRTALAAEPRERLRAGLRPRVRPAGAGLYALARRPPDTELERAEQVFGEARRALRERTLAALERRIADLPGPAFEALARVILQHEGFGPATFVKRSQDSGTIYVEAMRGRGGRGSKCLIGLRFGGSTAGRRSIGELRAGIRARERDEGLLLLAGRLGDDGIAEWKQPGPPIEIADGAALAETCVRHGVGVMSAMVSVDLVDADFFADIAEG